MKGQAFGFSLTRRTYHHLKGRAPTCECQTSRARCVCQRGATEALPRRLRGGVHTKLGGVAWFGFGWRMP